MDKYTELAEDILKHVGGKENVNSLKHCVTRLRFDLKDESKADDDYLKNRDGVVTVVKAGGQYQVVIGNHVPDVYAEVLQVGGLPAGGSLDIDEGDAPKGNLFDRFVSLVSSIFQPFLGPLAAAGIIKGIVAIMAACGLSAATSPMYVIFNAAGDGFFQFLPILIALTSARRFKVNEFTAIAIAAALVYPDIATLVTALQKAGQGHVLGVIPFALPAGGYLSTVMPSILAVWVASYIQKFFTKITPDVIKVFVVPFFTLLITVPLTFLVVGPVANTFSDGLTSLFQAIMNFSPIVFGLILGILWQVLVMFGMHWALVPLAILDVATNGSSTILSAAILPCFTQTGVLGAIMLKTKEEKVRTISMPAFISSIFGVTEPAIYGVTLPMKTPFYISCGVSGLMGAAMMALDIKTYSIGGLGVFVFPSLIGPDGNLSKVIIAIIIAIVGGVLAFLIQLFVRVPNLYGGGVAKVEEKAEEAAPAPKEIQQEIIASPLIGNVVPLDQVPDQVFASGAMGKGIAIDPTDGVIVAPAKATVNLVFPTGHAIGLTTENGVELLIHIGMDTVSLAGKGFKTYVEAGDVVEAGQKLIEFDLATIRDAKLPVITPVIVTNTADFDDVLTTKEARVNTGDYLLTAVK
ncbi:MULTISPECIES: beta-glucoside-specific PTS transporter subunit IIABC [Streptococcus]|uniref:beta-glucoside-specific PTS transporter subunit IIABC n=1 Tax=Streptococcus TaxID=1301 RepID=UPI00093A3448|nr:MULTISPECIES: beta-glucoside-specific PTS transporter subunit IIABC [Streptococcus]MBK5077994.1 PTS glucose transporter subunit IIA [Streptococcus sp. 22.1]MDU6911280.1 beta-glucoside-specific PTS transporter subunit IIABC [Streptococcus salivarius]